MNMMSAAKSKRASPVGVAGWTAEHGGMLHLQRFAPLRQHFANRELAWHQFLYLTGKNDW